MNGTTETSAINEIKEAMMVVIDYVKNLRQVIDLQGKVTEKLEQLVQSVADTTMETANTISNISDMIQGAFVQISDRFQIIELMQDAQLEYINAVSSMSVFSMFLGVFNTTAIVVIGIYLILRKR